MESMQLLPRGLGGGGGEKAQLTPPPLPPKPPAPAVAPKPQVSDKLSLSHFSCIIHIVCVQALYKHIVCLCLCVAGLVLYYVYICKQANTAWLWDLWRGKARGLYGAWDLSARPGGGPATSRGTTGLVAVWTGNSAVHRKQKSDNMNFCNISVGNHLVCQNLTKIGVLQFAHVNIL